MAEPAQIHLSKRFFKATEWAAARHTARSLVPEPPAPSLGQVLGIASLVLEDGGTEREAIAAMVLDALGGDDVPRDELRAAFGKKVARLVTRCADRGEAMATGDPSVLRVTAADTLRELRTLVADLRRTGSIAFARFAAPPNEQIERYRALVGACTQRLPRSPLVLELRATEAEMERLAELDTATAAWRVAHVDAA